MKLKVFSIMFLSLFIAGCGCGSIQTVEGDDANMIDPNEEVVVIFNDENLEALIREELEIEERDITSIDMQELYFLTINDISVEDLTGLEYAINLTEFSLMRESVESLEPIRNLTNLERFIIRYSEIENLPITFNEQVNLKHISIVGTIIEDATFVTNMTNLDHVTMTDAGIKDISAMENLINIEQLNLRGNEIEYIDSLSNMHALKYLNLQSNQISNVEPLEGLESLYDVVLSFNNVYNLKPLEELPSLGVLVIHLHPDAKYSITDQMSLFENKGIKVEYTR